MFTGEAYTYRGILTNDTESTNREVVAFYNGVVRDLQSRIYLPLVGPDKGDL